MSRTLGANPSTRYDVREGAKFAADTTLEVVSCSACGITYAIPESLLRSALAYRGDTPNGWKLCCPLGHTWWYVGETETARLTRQRDYARDEAARRSALLGQTRASLSAQKAAATRARNQRDRERRRVSGGVCPCCNRTFQNLGRHMASQHPDLSSSGDA